MDNVSNYSDYDNTSDVHQSNILKKQVDIDASKHKDKESDSETVEIQNQQTYNLRKTVQEVNDIKPACFLKTHPQHKTHNVQLLKKVDSFVPTFIGGSLPRHDTGNCEEYCLTMLTLFKPWSGSDLKADNDIIWHDAFEAHGFTNRQKEIIKFFHIQYKCNITMCSATVSWLA